MFDWLSHLPDVPSWLNWLVLIAGLLGITIKEVRDWFTSAKDAVASLNKRWARLQVNRLMRDIDLRRRAIGPPLEAYAQSPGFEARSRIGEFPEPSTGIT